MTVIRKDPEKPIDLSSIPKEKKNVMLMWRFENLPFAPVAPAGRANTILTDRWERNIHSISLAEPGDGPYKVLNVCHGGGGLHPCDKRREKLRWLCLARH